MSRKSWIILGIGVLFILAAFLLFKYELTKFYEDLDADPDADLEPRPVHRRRPVPDPEPEPEPEPVKEQDPPGGVKSYRPGYFYDKHRKLWFPVKEKQEPEIKATPAEFEEPEPVVINQ